MVTGDHPFTGKAISRQIGLLKSDENLELMEGEAAKGDWETSEGAVIHGSHINGLTDEQWRIILSKPGVCFARTTPAHKLMIVRQCQKMGHIVAVTGDGKYRALLEKLHSHPSLSQFLLSSQRCQRCSCSEASGCWNRHGVEWVRRRARRSRYITHGYEPIMSSVRQPLSAQVSSHQIDFLAFSLQTHVALLVADDNFASIVNGIEEGRIIFDNIKKTIAYTMAHIFPEVLSAIVALLAGLPAGLTAMMVLTIDLGTEMGPAISVRMTIQMFS
jgi:hypothetical protein